MNITLMPGQAGQPAMYIALFVLAIIHDVHGLTISLGHYGCYDIIIGV